MPNMNGIWPIPEEFVMNSSLTVLPTRNAQPTIFYKTTAIPIPNLENFPVDCYQLDPACLVSNFVMKTTVAGKTGLFLTIPGSALEVQPFGYLTTGMSRGHCQVFMYVLPYNFPLFFQLMSEYREFTKQQLPPSGSWRHNIDGYIRSIPPYYVPCLRTALVRWGINQFQVGNFIPETYDNGMSMALNQYLQDLTQQAKIECEQHE
eukprot:TRINITY_DN6902_c0_g5_i1.p1 TRINITY_DN6902_c0_g5~~TRINITY_DN6902_c0_g5_i1.p1  ORF type:complete len:205 (-),score=21.42 TRINITY_DN6902_c0_g5_i1:42-656(-)